MGIAGTYLNIINAIDDKPAANMIINGKETDLPMIRKKTRVSNIIQHSFESLTYAANLLQSCPILCDPIDSNSPGSPVPGILQARTLEWVTIFFSNA